MKKLLLVLCFLLFAVPAWAGTKTLTFAWNQEISTGFAGWKLYKAIAPNVAVSAANLHSTIPYGGTPSTEYTTSQPLVSPDNQVITYYFVLTAFDTAGNESLKSNEVSAEIDFQAPGVPVQLRVTVTTP